MLHNRFGTPEKGCIPSIRLGPRHPCFYVGSHQTPHGSMLPLLQRFKDGIDRAKLLGIFLLQDRLNQAKELLA